MTMSKKSIERFPAPHNFVFCDRNREPCFWQQCLAHGCMCAANAKDADAELTAKSEP